MLLDVIETIKEENKSHSIYTNKKIQIYSTPVTDFITDNIRDHLRRLYERGVLSKETYSEVCGDGNIEYNLEVIRRTREIENGEDELLYPPVLQNLEKDPADLTPERDINDDDIDDDKLPPNNQDYNAAEIAAILEGAPYSQPSDLPDSIKNNMVVNKK